MPPITAKIWIIIEHDAKFSNNRQKNKERNKQTNISSKTEWSVSFNMTGRP